MTNYQPHQRRGQNGGDICSMRQLQFQSAREDFKISLMFAVLEGGKIGEGKNYLI